jgi:hypothetical protein
MRETIFQSTEPMPPKTNSPDVRRVPQTQSELRAQNYVPSTMPVNNDVQSVDRPRRGHGY